VARGVRSRFYEKAFMIFAEATLDNCVHFSAFDYPCERLFFCYYLIAPSAFSYFDGKCMGMRRVAFGSAIMFLAKLERREDEERWEPHASK
jgi:hypothetical protein